MSDSEETGNSSLSSSELTDKEVEKLNSSEDTDGGGGGEEGGAPKEDEKKRQVDGAKADTLKTVSLASEDAESSVNSKTRDVEGAGGTSEHPYGHSSSKVSLWDVLHTCVISYPCKLKERKRCVIGQLCRWFH